MCGLSAIVDFVPRTGLARDLLAMHARIPHRGPDGEGFFVVGESWDGSGARDGAELLARVAGGGARAGLAFRWLQIQDRSPGAAQPMASADGGLRLIFNGEIYNFRELRRELETAGRVFATRSDTEVVLAAYERWGTGMFARLEGMWAIVLLDLKARRVVVSRDRFGIKPLFWRREGTRLVVASEVKQILAAGAPAAADVGSVMRFIRGARPLPLERTFFDSIQAQPPGTYAVVDLQGGPQDPRFVGYWSLDEEAARGAPVESFEQARERLDALLTQSVAEHMVAAVPVGLLVSGGLDSSLVAALSVGPYAARGERGRCYSMIPAGSASRLDESPYIARVVEAFGLEAHSAQLTPDWLRQRMAAITWSQEEPVAGIAVAAQAMVFELASRNGSRVVLDGQGADEVFAGYPRHQMAYLADCRRRRAFGELAVQAAAMLARDRGLARDLWHGTVTPRLRQVVGAGKAGRVDFIRPPHDRAPAPPAPAPLAQTLRRDIVAGNLRSVLALTDRNAMAHSVEARVPYVHRPIVELACALPDRYRLGGGRRKRLLRSLGEKYLPPGLAQRRDRIGFGAPTGAWLEGEFATELRALAHGPVFGTAATLDRDGIAAFVDSFLARRHRDAGTVWRLYAVDQWARAYAVTGL